jgi:transposase
MAPEMSVDLKERIVSWYLNDQLTYREISVRADCSIGHISNVMRNHRDFGQVNNPFSSHTGHPSAVEDADIEYIYNLLEANPVLYLDELQSQLLSVRNTHLLIATISRLLARCKLTRKHLQRIASERDEELRGIWKADMAQYEDPDVFVALDESAVDDQTIQRRFGRSMAGSPCVRRAAFLRGTRYSVLPALTTEGIIALDIFEGSVTKDRFLAFI